MLFHAKDVTYQREKDLFLDDLSFTVEQPSNNLIVAKSGQVTSLLAEICAGVQCPDQGKVFYQGEPIQNHKLASSYVPAHAGLISNRTIEENIVLRLRYHPELGKYYTDERINEVLQKFKLENDRDKLPMEISSKKKKAAGLARAFITEPELMIIENPYENISRQEITQLIEYLDGLRKRIGTVILMFSNQFPYEAEVYNSIGVIKNGNLIGPEKPSDIMDHRYVKDAFRSVS
jgi:ABC-type multidrug transport system ATPase subunit